MQTLLRLINIVLAPILTVVFGQAFAVAFAGKAMGEKDMAQALGVVAAGVIVLVVELVLGGGPKFSSFLRRWLDSRALFEGLLDTGGIRGTTWQPARMFFLHVWTAHRRVLSHR